MNKKQWLNQLLLTLITMAALCSAPVFAQKTSSALRGTVTSQSGTPLPGSIVLVRNEDSGLTRTVQTNTSGVFSIRNLPVGSAYSITVTSTGYGGEKVSGVALNLGQTADINFDLVSGGTMEEVVVLGSRTVGTQIALGPSAVFGLAELESAPAINRNITDVLRADPRIYVDESRGGINAVQCGGKNSRYSSLTVDGVRMNDSFGLNENGYPTERMPFSYDAISQVAVELAPFDVEYGGFTACNINAVTKSGGNEIHGSVFYDYTSDSLRGDELEGDDIDTGDYTEKRWGVNVGGPIIKDKLFFFAAYEKLEGANLFDRGAIGSGAVNEVPVTQAELDEIAQIARDIYGYDPGGIPDSLDHDDEKLLLRADWNINDAHRLAFIYNYNDGFNYVQSDGDNDEFEFTNHLYDRGSELNTYTGTLYSDWTPELSTEMRFGYLDLDNHQISVGGTDFGEMRVELADVDVYLGGDDSRQANSLDYTITSFALKAKYLMNGHMITVGAEREDLDIFNLFVQHTETEIRFDGIDNFRDGFADAIYYNNAPSHNPEDAAAEWGYAVNTVYIQDDFEFSDRLSVVFGLRYDWYTTSDEPAKNEAFTAEYGFSNTNTLDGEGLIQPRFGFTFVLSEDTTITGGLGLYSGGNPNVWLSNTYSANNVLQFGQRGRSFGYTDGSRSLFDDDVEYSALESGVPDGPGYAIPSELYDAVTAGDGDNFEINYLDPGFDLPSEWKLALGVTHRFAGDYLFNADFIATQAKDTAIVKHGDLEQVGTNEDGYPQYDSVREASFVLINSSKGDESMAVSFGLARNYDNGFDWRVGYAYTDAKDVSPMTSSVAFSNYQNRAFFDPEEDVLSTSNYNIEHRFTLTANYRHEFFNGYMTTMSVYGSANSGVPYSRTYNGTIDPYGFTPYLDFRDNVLEPGEDRNSHEGSWWRKIDLRIEQELPGLRADDRATAFLTIDNFTNLLNDDWGVLYKPNFPNTVAIGDEPESRIGDASRYEIRLGVTYGF